MRLNRVALTGVFAVALVSCAVPVLTSPNASAHSSRDNAIAQDSAAGKIAPIPGNSYEVKQLALGVYAAVRHIDVGSVDGNTMFIVNDADVTVVDTGLYLMDARQMIAEIRKVTNKPVRYVINTHSHGDHLMGNQIFAETFPGVEFIAHTATRSQVIKDAAADTSVENYRAEIANVQKQLDAGNDGDGVR